MLNGEGPRFLQAFEAIDGRDWPVASLLIDAPGDNTIRPNTDLFIKRGQIRVLSRASAAMALYTLQQFAPSGGAGHRTSLRGGGPLVTLALPDGDSTTHPTLWQRLWLNTPSDCRLDPEDREKHRAWPWLAATRTSARNEVVHAADVHKLQAFFGMPRRIRLAFSENTGRLPCDVTGAIDDIVCLSFTAVPWGTNYGIWRHPLTPYYDPKATSNEAAWPVHAPDDRLGYRRWLGLVVKGERQHPAAAITTAKRRLIDLGKPWKDNSRLLAGGYAMDNMKPLAFAEAEMPLHRLDPQHAAQVENLARLMVEGASAAAGILRMAIRKALFAPRAEVKAGCTVLDSAREDFWERTDADFHRMLDEALDRLADDPRGEEQDRIAQTWRAIVKKAACDIFDDVVPVDSLDVLAPERIVDGRRDLVFALDGYGKQGVGFFKTLGLTPPEVNRK